jgi:hypothetical protein
MENEFVTFEQAVELKKLLYGEHYGDDYLAWYSSNKDFHYRNINSPVYPNNQSFIAPLKQQVFRWFREKYNLIGLIEGGYDSYKNVYSYVIWKGSYDDWLYYYWDTYEEAENACIDKLIEIAKQKDNG